MTINDGGQSVTVNVGACRCPGTPHAPDGDSVYLAPETSMTMGLRGNGAISKAGGDEALLEILLGRVLIEEGIVGWTFLEEGTEDGKTQILPVPVDPENIERMLPWGKGGSDVAERANDLYGEAILGPLVRRSMLTQQPGQTNGSISPNRASRRKSRTSSKSYSPASSVTSP
jgi:hypothetical protein